ncbi:unnamed protein product (macronuclear) [Paramecium tetraurelia]|uniref:Transmembrane protein n=1 Tax=Paramecium tetraurelia TaxID=5888 RepID=A0C1P7_PARTE|nr:uncharacterized protein GSPATT00034191001 [Paramecium tetraurelia]CAK64714.1 unnamed protein product [Paramecium tetraurelia]|eukprot:XP_001432111.1 hypothetical protein (macronuclear) [Paramecium tetraurelia strain d4-2]
MKGLFLLINIYFAIGLLICKDQLGLTLQLDKSITIPNYNCTLNVSNDKLINMTSLGGQLKITGTELLLNQNILLQGFQLVEFQNITINTQTKMLSISTQVHLNNVTLTSNCQINATKIFIRQTIMTKMIFQYNPVFASPVDADGLIISNSTFFRSSLVQQLSRLRNIIFDQVSFINSTLATVALLRSITFNNSFVIQSILIVTDISQEITIQNSYFTLSTALQVSGALYTNIINVTFSQSHLMMMQSNNQIQIVGNLFHSIISDSKLIVAESKYIQMLNTSMINVQSEVLLDFNSQNILLKKFALQGVKGSLMINKYSSSNVMITQFTIESCQSVDPFFSANGTLQIYKGHFDSTLGSIFNKSSIKELLIDQVNFTRIFNSTLINVKQSSLVQITNLLVTNCSSISIAKLSNNVNIVINMITMQNCEECNFLCVKNSQIKLNLIKLFEINNFQIPLIAIQKSNFIIKQSQIFNVIQNYKQVIRIEDGSKVIFTDFQCYDITCQSCDGVIVIKNCSYIEIKQCNFRNSISLLGYMNIQNNGNVIAQNNIFTNLTGNEGSAFVITNSSVKIFENQFNNLYSADGGVITFNQTGDATHYIEYNSYKNCSMKNDKQIHLITNQIVEPDLNTYINGPVYITLHNTTYLLDHLIKKNAIIEFDQLKSGQKIEFMIAILDSGKNRLCNFSNYLSINFKIFQFNSQKCQYEISYSQYQSLPKNQQVELQIEFPQFKFYNDTFKLSIYLNMIECEIGEAWMNQTCLRCPAGTYSLTNFKQCQQCITSIELCPGGSQLMIKQGYWRPNNLTDQIEYCGTFQSSCQGGEQNFTCSQGYVGALCNDCDYYAVQWNASYTRNQGGNCSLCQNDAFNILKIFLSFLWILVALFISVRGSLKLVRSQLSAYYLRMMGIFFATRSTMFIDQTEILIKSVSSYFQLISISLIIEFEFPMPIVFFAQVIGNPLSTIGYSIECFLLQSNIEIEIVYLRQFWNLFFSLLFVFSFVFIYSLIQFCKTKPLEDSTRNIFITSVIQVNFYFQGDIIEGLLKLMFCIKASGQYYIQAATSYLCYTDEYYFYLQVFIIPTLLIVGVISPIFYIVKLYMNKNKLWTCKLRMPYGYLYVEYKDRYYYWEFICFFVKSIFYFLKTLLIQDIKLMFLFAILILLIYLELLTQHQPYIEKQYNFIDKISTQLAMITLICTYSQFRNPYSWMVYLLSITCSSLNLMYCSYIAMKIIKEYLSGLKQQHLEKIVNLVLRYPCLKYCIKKPKNYHAKRKACYLWKKARVYVMEFIGKLKLQKSNLDLNSQFQIHSNRPNTSSTYTTISLLNSIAPQLVKYIKFDRNKLNQRVIGQNEFTSVISAYIDPENPQSPDDFQLPKKSTISTIFGYVNDNNIE